MGRMGKRQALREGGSEPCTKPPEAPQMADRWPGSDRPPTVWLQLSFVYASRITTMAPAESLAHD